MTRWISPYSVRKPLPTWSTFRRDVRKEDRETLLVQAAAASALIARDELPEEGTKLGLTPWNIADVARTSLAWGRFARPRADGRTLMRLCNMSVNLADEGQAAYQVDGDRVARLLTRLSFEQFPGQRSIMAEVSRSLLLFGSASEQPDRFAPEVMTDGWFEAVTSGLTLDEYVEAVLFIAVSAEQNSGGFSLDWLESPAYQPLREVISFDSIRRTFNEHLSTSVAEFKEVNRVH